MRKILDATIVLICPHIFKKQGYLRNVGWPKSIWHRIPINQDGKPLPWYSYSCIHFLEKKVKKSFTVFEFGSGNSTLWWAEKCTSIYSCEHNLQWYNNIAAIIPNNVILWHIEFDINGTYSNAALETKAFFDIVVIDGIDRINCAIKAVKSLTPNGVIIWDDSEREIYNQGYDYLNEKGFKRIDFIGLGPVTNNRQSTSVFYRENNCFGL